MEILCARFQSAEHQECLAIWTPNGTTDSLEDLRNLYTKLTEHLSQPFIFYGWLAEGRMHSIGQQNLINDLENTVPEKLDWQMASFTSKRAQAAAA